MACTYVNICSCLHQYCVHAYTAYAYAYTYAYAYVYADSYARSDEDVRMHAGQHEYLQIGYVRSSAEHWRGGKSVCGLA